MAMQTRQELETQLAELRRDRGVAALDGKRRDRIDSEIAATVAARDAEEDAEAERIRRQREREAKDAAASRAHKIKRIGALEGDRLKGWSDVEAAARALLEAIGRVKASAESERVLWTDIGEAVPVVLGPFESNRRLRGRIGEFLVAAKIGLEVPGAGGIFSQAPLQDWTEEERKMVAPHLQTLEVG